MKKLKTMSFLADTNYESNQSTEDRTATIIASGGGCSDTVTVVQRRPDPCYIDITPSRRDVSYSAGQTSFSVSSNVTCAVSDDASWLTASIDGSTINVSYDENALTYERTATITVSGGQCDSSVIVVQNGKPCFIDITPSSRSVDASSGSTSFSVSSNVTWSVSDDASWLTADKSGNSVNINFDANPTTNQRTAAITLTGEDCIEIVTVVQAKCYINVSPLSINVSSSAGTKELDVASNLDWDVTENVSWLDARKVDSENITIDYNSNESSTERSAIITVSGTCQTTEDVTITQAGLPDAITDIFENYKLTVFPNPASDKIYLKSEIDVNTDFIVTIFNDIGRMVFCQQYDNLYIDGPLEIDIKGFKGGLYLFRINNSKAYGTIRVIKE